MLSLEQIQSRLPVDEWGSEIEYFDRLESTNDRAKVLAEKGAQHGSLVVADEQTAGKGRGDHRWFTPPHSALALSLVVKPTMHQQAYLGALSALGALAVVEALAGLDLKAQVKWPNDVLLEGRKVAGILTEAAWQAEQVEYAIVGIGVNVRQESVPSQTDLQWPATCVEAVIGRRIDRLDLLVDILREFANRYNQLGQPELVSAWEQRLAFKGEPVQLQRDQEMIAGLLSGLDASGRLVLETDQGTTRLASGSWRFSRVDRPGN